MFSLRDETALMLCELDGTLNQARTGAATTGSRDAATSGCVDNAAAPLREGSVDHAVALLRCLARETPP